MLCYFHRRDTAHAAEIRLSGPQHSALTGQHQAVPHPARGHHHLQPHRARAICRQRAGLPVWSHSCARQAHPTPPCMTLSPKCTSVASYCRSCISSCAAYLARECPIFTPPPSVYAVGDWQYCVMDCLGCKGRKMHSNQLMRSHGLRLRWRSCVVCLSRYATASSELSALSK